MTTRIICAVPPGKSEATSSVVVVPSKLFHTDQCAAVDGPPSCSRHRDRRAVRSSGREIGIVEQVARRAGFLRAVDSSFHANLMQEGDVIERECLRSERLLVEVAQMIGTDQVITLGVRAYFNACAALRGTVFKSGAVVGERIRAIGVNKGH